MKKKATKSLYALVAMLLALCLLAGCGSSGSGSQAAASAPASAEGAEAAEATDGTEAASATTDDEDITITMYWANIDSEQAEVWQTYIFDPFIEKHPNVTVDFQTLPELQNTLRVQLAAGAGPDLFYIDGIDIPEYTSAGVLLELDKYREQYDLDNEMYDYALRTGTYNDHLYGIPHSIEAAAMTYNLDLIKELGMDVPTTRDEYVALCEAAQAAGKLPVSFGYSGNTIYMGWYYDHYMATYAGIDKVAQLLSGEITFEDQDIRDSFALMKADWDAGFINDKKSGAISLDEARSLFANGEAVMSFEGGWVVLADRAYKNWDFDWGQAAWPSMRDGIPACGAISIGEFIGVNANSPHADLCMEMMMDFYLNDQQVADAVAHGFSTPCKDLDESLLPADLEEGIRKGLEFQEEILGSEHLSYHVFSYFPSKLINYLNDNMDKLLYDQIDLDQLMTEAQEKLNQDFEEGYVFPG